MINDINHIIAKVLSGRAGTEDVLIFNDWLNQSEKNKLEFSRLSEYWNVPVNIEDEMPDITSDFAFEKLTKRLDRPRKKKINIIPGTRFISVAASVTLLIAGVFIIYFLQKNELPPDEYFTYVCPSGNYEMTLPEGSTVYLNENSRLTYSNGYNREKRSVTLEGEAYFDVVKSETPFELTLGEVSIEVLGTRFNISAYKGQEHIIATLEEGSIRFRNGDRQIMLAPGQQLTYDRNTSDIDIREVEVDLYTAWKEGLYKYRRITLQQLCLELENKFGVEIAVSPRLKDISVTGSFERHQSLDEILGIMKKSVSFKWKRIGNKITIQ